MELLNLFWSELNDDYFNIIIYDYDVLHFRRNYYNVENYIGNYNIVRTVM